MKRELRAAQLIGAGGVGAIIDMGDESFVIEDITQWRKGPPIEIPRLSGRLNKPLYAPPYTGEGGRRGHVEMKRFPGALFCVSCRTLKTGFQESVDGRDDGERPDCRECRGHGMLTPMRFVLACRNGHLHDVPWARWAHSRGNNCGSNDLKFEVDRNSGGAGLKSLYVECKNCGEKRDLEQLPSKGAMRSIGFSCRGTHPWHAAESECNEPLLVLQRGATNLHYAEIIGALDIGEQAVPAVDSHSELKVDSLFEMLRENIQLAPNVGNHVNEGAKRLAARLGMLYGLEPEEIIRLAQGSALPADAAKHDTATLIDSLLSEEWTFLTSPSAGSVNERNLVTRESPPPRFRQSIQPFSRVLLIERLREVRTMPSFSRIDPGAVRVSVDVGRLDRYQSWLPAVEVFGEGIFLQFDEAFVSDWESRLADTNPEAVEECTRLERVRLEGNYWFLPEVSPRFIAIHTVAHLLMRQLTFECGYSSSALRERIWASPSARSAGILIYTADGDSEGALGGLVRQGQPERLGDLISSALDKAKWCSADPVCSESKGQGLGGFNRGACHACTLVPETSCTFANTVLNRLHVVGRHDVMAGLLEGI